MGGERGHLDFYHDVLPLHCGTTVRFLIWEPIMVVKIKREKKKARIDILSRTNTGDAQKFFNEKHFFRSVPFRFWNLTFSSANSFSFRINKMRIVCNWKSLCSPIRDTYAAVTVIIRYTIVNRARIRQRLTKSGSKVFDLRGGLEIHDSVSAYGYVSLI